MPDPVSCAASEAGDAVENFICPTCSKSYQRRDLLTRHRRRCQGPARPLARRKACDACVQAKTKCCYSQPSCARCTKRRIRCHYASNSVDDSTWRPPTDMPEATEKNLAPQPSEPLLLPTWTADMESWALSNFKMGVGISGDFPASTSPLGESYFLPQDDMQFVSSFTLSSSGDISLPADMYGLTSPTNGAPGRQAVPSEIPTAGSTYSASEQSTHRLSNASTAPYTGPDMRGLPAISKSPSGLPSLDEMDFTSMISESGHEPMLLDDPAGLPSSYKAPSAAPKSIRRSSTGESSTASSHNRSISRTSFAALNHLVRPQFAASLSRTASDAHAILTTLYEYPSLLLEDGFHTPLLHASLYGYDNPDITLLPLTTMAISCGGGLLHKESSRFMKRAMDGERQRLIKQYPDYRCMQQWDALHAMALYELLELRDTAGEDREDWKLRPRVLGLRFPFILKMAQIYAKSYPELRNPNFTAFDDVSSTPDLAIKGAWHRWRITETARRTLFMLNMVNWYSYLDLATGKQLPYYESLCDDIVLDLPLPCSEAAWSAPNENEWRVAMQAQQVQKELDSLQIAPELTLAGAVAFVQQGNHQRSQQIDGTDEDEDSILDALSDKAGFGDSEQFRALVLFAACLQVRGDIQAAATEGAGTT